MSVTTFSTSAHALPVAPKASALTPLSVGNVALDGGFWGTRQQLNSAAIIPHAMDWMDRLGWIGNLENAHHDRPYVHHGRQFADSEVYKLLEAVSWNIARGDTSNEGMLNRLIPAIAGAQDPDGYLQTMFGRPWQQPRYSDFQWGHELYCFGHFLQAAVAHQRATGDSPLLAPAKRLADHVCTMFGPDGLERVCGHAEIELGLVELYRETGERRYLDQAKLFIERRGAGTLPLFEFGPAFWQDDVPVREATVLRGHAVRALYLAAGAVDVAVETNDDELLDALETQWENTVSRRTYITGGMGSHHMDEAYGEDYVLPADRSYCETCAGVASIMFSWRLLLATGKSRYADLIERTLYNIVATSPSADGHAFFYANTLHQRVEQTVPSLNEDGVVIRGGAAGRQPWFEVSCCPPNLARTLASLAAYIATGDEHSVQIHQYASGSIAIGLTELEISTDYPTSGTVRIQALRAPADGVALTVRVPDWAESAYLTGPQIDARIAPGYSPTVVLEPNQTLILEIPLELLELRPDERIDAIRGTVAFQRGPEIFALESVDLPESIDFDDAVVVTGSGRWEGDNAVAELAQRRRTRDRHWPYGPDGASRRSPATEAVRLVRYHEWAERGPSRMRVWIPAS